MTRLSIDIDTLGPAILADEHGRVIDANEHGRRWLREDGGAPALAAATRGQKQAPACGWVDRATVDGDVVHAVMTAVPQPDGQTLLLIAEPPEDRGPSTTHMRAVLDGLPAMVGYWDHDLRNRFANRAYVEWFGTTPEQIAGRHIRDLLGQELYAKNLPFIQAALAGEIQHFERAIPRPDGDGVRHSNATYVPDWADGKVVGFSVLVVDVTELKTAETELRAARDALESRVKERTIALTQTNAELARSNGELAQFAHIASHDLQEPVRTVSNFCELLRERYGDQLDERGARYLQHAVDGAKRMQATVSALLAVAKLGGATRELSATSASDAARGALAALRLRVEETAAEISVEPLPLVCSDPVELAEVFQNLISNALRFTTAQPPKVTIRAREAGLLVEISVTDNGIGLEPKNADRVFGMFQRLHSVAEYPGAGIGLALVKKIIERHGGSVGVRSSLGQGATFWFTLKKPRTQSNT